MMERDDTIAARGLQSKLIDRRFDLAAQKDALQHRLNSFTMIGFTAQQIGFVLVLFSGLVAQHLTERKKATASPE